MCQRICSRVKEWTTGMANVTSVTAIAAAEKERRRANCGGRAVRLRYGRHLASDNKKRVWQRKNAGVGRVKTVVVWCGVEGECGCVYRQAAGVYGVNRKV